jgi:hypothetical protein
LGGFGELFSQLLTYQTFVDWEIKKSGGKVSGKQLERSGARFQGSTAG